MTLGDAVSRKSLMKMVYRKFPKTACHYLSPVNHDGDGSGGVLGR